MPAPHPPEFRRRAVELAREVDEDGNRMHPLAQLARDLRISESCLRNWLADDAVEAGVKPGLTRAEREKLVRLRRENWVLRAERDLLSRRISDGGIEMFRPYMVNIERYRYRGARIPIPWSSATTTGSPAPAA